MHKSGEATVIRLIPNHKRSAKTGSRRRERPGFEAEKIMGQDAKKAVEPKGRVLIDAERCKGCGFCIEFCPTRVLEFSDEFNTKGYHPPRAVRPQECSGCDLCGIYCPDFAIFGIRIKAVA